MLDNYVCSEANTIILDILYEILNSSFFVYVGEQFLYLSFALLMLISYSLGSTPVYFGVRHLFLSSCFTARHRSWTKSPTDVLKERIRMLSAMRLCSNFSALHFPFRASAEAPPGTLLRQGSGKTSATAVQPLRPPW